MQLRKAHCSPPLVGEDNSMVFTPHSVPFPATSDLRSWLEMAPRERQKPFHFLHTSDGKQILISKMSRTKKFDQLDQISRVSGQKIWFSDKVRKI